MQPIQPVLGLVFSRFRGRMPHDEAVFWSHVYVRSIMTPEAEHNSEVSMLAMELWEAERDDDDQ